MGWQDAPLIEEDAAAPAAGESWMNAPVVGEKAPEKPAALLSSKSKSVKESESPTSPKNLAGAAVEPLLAMASGFPAMVLGGLAGLGTAIGGGNGARKVERIQNALTYEPRTVGGKNAMKVIGAPAEWLSEGATKAGEIALDITGSPAVAAAIKTGLEVVPQIALAKGVGKGVPTPTPRVIPPEVATLESKGVSVPIGESLGGGWARAEAQMARRPIAGIPIRAAQERSLIDFNRAFVDDALADVGVRLPDGVIGKQAIKYAKEKFTDEYTTLLGQMKGELDAGRGPSQLPAVPGSAVPPQTPSLRMELDSLKNMAQTGNMPKKFSAELSQIIDDEIIKRFGPNGVVSGETVKEVQSQIRAISKAKMRSEDYNVRKQGLALKEANSAIDRMVREVNPQFADALKSVDAGYAKFKIAQAAVKGSTNADGLVTPTGFMRAVRAKDFTKDKSAYTSGTALQQDLATAASKYVPDTLPEKINLSQLAGRVISHKYGLGALGVPGGAGIAAVLSPLYSRGGSNMARRAMSGNRMNPKKRAVQAAVFGFGSLDDDD